MEGNQNISSLELKKILFEQIAEIQDVNFLKAIQTILDSKSEIVSLSATQREEIRSAKAEIKKGEFFTQDQIDLSIEK